MCALITHYRASPVQAEQQGIARHMVIMCRDRKRRPAFQLAKLYLSKDLGLLATSGFQNKLVMPACTNHKYDI